MEAAVAAAVAVVVVVYCPVGSGLPHKNLYESLSGVFPLEVTEDGEVCMETPAVVIEVLVKGSQSGQGCGA